MTTLRAAQSELRAIGVTLTKVSGEYSVYPKGQPCLAYFTDDIDDALKTGRLRANTSQTYKLHVRPSTYAETHPTAGPDFYIQNEGTLYLLIPSTPQAKTWADDNLPEDAPRLGQNVAIEHRYILAIVDGIRDKGLTVAGR